jgi:hypothetical protein
MKARFFLFCLLSAAALPLAAQSSMLLHWDPVTGANGYRLTLQKHAPYGWETILEKQTTELSMALSLQAASYRYRVEAHDPLGGWSKPSAWNYFVVKKEAKPPKPAPAPKPAPKSEKPAGSGREAGSITQAPPAKPAPEAPKPAPEPEKPAGSSNTVASSTQSAVTSTQSPVPAFHGLAAGIGPYAGFMDTNTGLSLGGSLSLEYRFNRCFALGTMFNAGYGKNKVSSVESGLFARWYPVVLRTKAGCTWLELAIGPFIGAMTAFPNNDLDESRGSIDASLDIACRFVLSSFYIEPFVRGGYPFLASAGIRFGWRAAD